MPSSRLRTTKKQSSLHDKRGRLQAHGSFETPDKSHPQQLLGIIFDNKYSTNTRHKAVLGLQRRMGNRFVSRVLETQHVIPRVRRDGAYVDIAGITERNLHTQQLPTNGRMVMRSTLLPAGTEESSLFGLKEASTVSENLKEATRTFGEEKSMTVKSVVEKTLADANQDMAEIPTVRHEFRPTAGYAAFRSQEWAMWINNEHFSKTVGDLTAGEYADLVASIYHEARHAEQFFTAARMVAARIGALGAKRELRIPIEIARAAKAVPLDASTDQDMLEQAERWYKFIAESGQYREYAGLVKVFNREVSALISKLITILDFPDEGVQTDEFKDLIFSVDLELRNWADQRKPELESEQDKVAGVSPQTDIDKMVQQNLTHIMTALDEVLGLWDGGQLTQDPVAFKRTVGSFALKVNAVLKKLNRAYLEFPDEADAWQVGGMTTNLIRFSRGG